MMGIPLSSQSIKRVSLNSTTAIFADLPVLRRKRSVGAKIRAKINTTTHNLPNSTPTSAHVPALS